MDDDTFRSQQLGIKNEALKFIKWRKPRPLDHPKARFPGFHQRVNEYKAGQVVSPGGLPLPADLVMHESVAMTLKDGVNLYSDIFVPSVFKDLDNPPKDSEPIPAVIAWSPYGKQGGTHLLDDFPFRAGVPKNVVSGFQKWEGPDPATWCEAGYAIINVDTRGAFTSDGDIHLLGNQDAEDGAEFVEWVASQKWCNGKVGFAGNSWLSMMQWRIGSLRPKGLAALAPWEALADWYQDDIMRGGIPFYGFQKSVMDTFAGKGRLEDGTETAEENPLFNAYWEDKVSHPERINVPVYVVASWTNPIHTTGTLRSYEQLPDGQKWLRIHNSLEWPDFYNHQTHADLLRFFDFYLKGKKDNGWDATPKVRISALDYGMAGPGDIVNRAEPEWPLPRTKHIKHFLNSDGSLSLGHPTGQDSTLSYDSQKGKISFTYTFPKDQETTGHFMAHLNVSCPSHDDMDLFVQVEKIDSKGHRKGTMLFQPPFPFSAILKKMHDWNIGLEKAGIVFYWGPEGRLRVSHAMERDESSNKFEAPYYTHRKQVKLKEGEVRAVDIHIRPSGILWKKGDILRFSISGKLIIPFPLPEVGPIENFNRGEHIVHLGGKGEDSSYLLVPYV